MPLSVTGGLLWVRTNALRLIFPLTLPWIPLFLSAEYFYNLTPEGEWLHKILESVLIPGALVVSILVSMLMYRLWPAFLRVDSKVTVWFVLKKTLVHTVVVYFILTIATVLVSLLLDPSWESKDVQHIPYVFFAVIFYPPLLTPVFVIIAIWRSILQKTRACNPNVVQAHAGSSNMDSQGSSN